jgi:hypothetical protein
MNRRANNLGVNSVLVPLCAPQIPQGLARQRIRASAMRGRRQTAWAKAESTVVREIRNCFLTSKTQRVALIILRRCDNFWKCLQGRRRKKAGHAACIENIKSVYQTPLGKNLSARNNYEELNTGRKLILKCIFKVHYLYLVHKNVSWGSSAKAKTKYRIPHNVDNLLTRQVSDN